MVRETYEPDNDYRYHIVILEQTQCERKMPENAEKTKTQYEIDYTLFVKSITYIDIFNIYLTVTVGFKYLNVSNYEYCFRFTLHNK